MDAALPVLKLPVDQLRDEPRSLAHEHLPKHPIERVQAMTHKQAWDSKVARVGQIYGSHASLRLQMDRAILAQFQRLPGMHSNFSGLDTLLGRDEDIGFEDYLNDPKDMPEKPGMGMHAMLRQRLLQ
mmetsp:Transcript_2404/g.5186  ORF Transcript_2404/g.5186 Transcript_2404/m.5186 type:complete len:127 (+) Transcript_2404:67-447(+)